MKEYLLEWQWLFDGGDDAYDTEIGSSDNLEYHVCVTVACFFSTCIYRKFPS